MTTTDTTEPALDETPGPTLTAAGVRRQLGAAVRVLLVLTLLLGVGYPAVVYGVAHLPGLADHAEATGTTLVGVDPVPADPAADPWFHTRPGAAAPGASGGSNLGPTNEDLRAAVDERRAAIAAREGVDPAAVPPDALTASGSGLDPDISPAYVALQAPRVARVTGLPVAAVRALVAQATSGRSLGILGEPRVNVPELNAAVRAAAPQAR